MPRYFDAEKVVNTLFSMRCKCDTNDIDDYYNMLSCAFDVLPTVDVVERKVGEWIWDDEMGVFLCSSCKNGWKDQPTLMGKPLFEWCPVCGAEMEKGEEE